MLTTVAFQAHDQEWKRLQPVRRSKSTNITSSTNMADAKFLPVDALARQQLNRRAQTAQKNFIVTLF